LRRTVKPPRHFVFVGSRLWCWWRVSATLVGSARAEGGKKETAGETTGTGGSVQELARRLPRSVVGSWRPPCHWHVGPSAVVGPTCRSSNTEWKIREPLLLERRRSWLSDCLFIQTALRLEEAFEGAGCPAGLVGQARGSIESAWFMRVARSKQVEFFFQNE